MKCVKAPPNHWRPAGFPKGLLLPSGASPQTIVTSTFHSCHGDNATVSPRQRCVPLSLAAVCPSAQSIHKRREDFVNGVTNLPESVMSASVCPSSPFVARPLTWDRRSCYKNDSVFSHTVAFTSPLVMTHWEYIRRGDEDIIGSRCGGGGLAYGGWMTMEDKWCSWWAWPPLQPLFVWALNHGCKFNSIDR